MAEPFISYVLTTRNKCILLQELLDDFFSRFVDDEEIIIIDSKSTDGTMDLLEKYAQNHDQVTVVSEPDIGEAHGINKGILLARGQVIKILSDDDVFDWNVIRKIAQDMVNDQYDFAFSAGFSNDKEGYSILLDYHRQWQRWQKKKVPFEACGLGWFFSKKALALCGIFDVRYKRVDAELSLRISSIMGIRINYYSQPLWYRRWNKNSNSQKYSRSMKTEMLKLLFISGGFKAICKWMNERFITRKNSIKFKNCFNEIDTVPDYNICKSLLESYPQNISYTGG